jgi:hypothetical protein
MKVVTKLGEVAVFVHRKSAAVASSVNPPKVFFQGGEKKVHEKASKDQAKSHGTSYV